jgi:hypothetical protein
MRIKGFAIRLDYPPLDDNVDDNPEIQGIKYHPFEREMAMVERLQLALATERGEDLVVDRQHPPGLGRFRLLQDVGMVDALERPPDSEAAAREVDVFPAQPEHLRLVNVERQGDDVDRAEPVALDGGEDPFGVRERQILRFRCLRARRDRQFCHVAVEDVPRDRLVERPAEDRRVYWTVRGDSPAAGWSARSRCMSNEESFASRIVPSASTMYRRTWSA